MFQNEIVLWFFKEIESPQQNQPNKAFEIKCMNLFTEYLKLAPRGAYDWLDCHETIWVRRNHQFEVQESRT